MKTLVLPCVLLLLPACLPPGAGDGGVDPRDVRGNYALTYDDQLKLQLNIGGAIREVTQSGYGGIADFGTYNGQPVQLDLTAFCAKPEVQCPSEAFWSKVSIDMPDLQKNRLLLQGMQVVDDDNTMLDAGQHAAVVGGLVDHGNDDRFVVGLGLGGGQAYSCAAVDVSFATGRFSRVGEQTQKVTVYRLPSGASCDPDAGTSDAGAGDAGVCGPVLVDKLVVPAGALVDGIKEGRIGLAWAGGCAFGPILVGATLYLETGYTGSRTGKFDPPPYVPAPVTLPDGGFPDAGTDGGP